MSLKAKAKDESVSSWKLAGAMGVSQGYALDIIREVKRAETPQIKEAKDVLEGWKGVDVVAGAVDVREERKGADLVAGAVDEFNVIAEPPGAVAKKHKETEEARIEAVEDVAYLAPAKDRRAIVEVPGSIDRPRRAAARRAPAAVRRANRGRIDCREGYRTKADYVRCKRELATILEGRSRMPEKLDLYQLRKDPDVRGSIAKYGPPVSLLRETVRPASGRLFADDALFDNLPEFELGKIGRGALRRLEELASIETEVFRSAGRVDAAGLCKNKGNTGQNLGISFVGGGRHSSVRAGYSGSMHCAQFVKQRPELRRRILQCLQDILYSAFGKRPWFKRLCSIGELLDKEEGRKSGQRRTVPGLPITGVWLARYPKERVVHVDEDVVGVSFVFTTRHYKGSSLCVLSRDGKVVDHLLVPGEILAGTWTNDAHCNVNVHEHEGRTSWTLYLDARSFSRRYKCVKTVDY
jgi:hypothetical protein